MFHLWYDRDGLVLRTSKTTDVTVIGAAGWIGVTDEVAAAVELRMDIYRVVGGVLMLDGDPVAMPPEVPASVTSSQAKRAMIYSGVYEAIEAYVMAVQDYPLGLVYQIVWDAPFWFRNSPELGTLAAELGMTAEQVDDLFRLAGTL